MLGFHECEIDTDEGLEREIDEVLERLLAADVFVSTRELLMSFALEVGYDPDPNAILGWALSHLEESVVEQEIKRLLH